MPGAASSRLPAPPRPSLRGYTKIAVVLLTTDMRERLIVIGVEASGRGPNEFDTALRAEYDATGKLVSEIGLKVD